MQPLLEIMLDLCANLAAEDRYRRLAAAVRRLVPCDSTAILRLQDGVLVPVVTDGLVPETLGRRFVPADHPRLQRILASERPVRFLDSALPDPFDGLLLCCPDMSGRIHACMGARLQVEGSVVGLLAVDALDPGAFDGLDMSMVASLTALTGAAMRTTGLIERLEGLLQHSETVAQDLQRLEAQRHPEFLGQGPVARHLLEEVALLSGSDLTVLIQGETGVGKEVIAGLLHTQSRRKDRPLIYVNCAALPESIAESELFGHVRGAFTGAAERRAGKFEVADRGTLLLDEIGELPLTLQPKLLRALQSGEVQRVGSDAPQRVDVRVLAATNRNLAEEVRAGRFRADLYHRLSVYPLHIPPLRERLEDIPLLSGYFLDVAQAQLGLGPVRLTPEARDRLLRYRWPGNVRELRHLLLRAALRAAEGRRREGVVVRVEHLGLEEEQPGVPAEPAQVAAQLPPEFSLSEVVDAYRRRAIETMLERTGGNWAEAARRLRLDRGNLHRMAQRLGLLSPRHG